MKLSIWQQFSSNHSSMFYVIGIFKNIEDAKAANKVLESMMYSNYEIQKIFAERLHIRWEQTDFFYSPDMPLFKLFESIIVMKNTDDTTMNKTQFEDLLRALGADTAGYDIESFENNSSTFWRMKISGFAPNEETLERIVDYWDNHIYRNNSAYPAQNNSELQIEKLFLTYESDFSFDTLVAFLTKLRDENCEKVQYSFAKVNIP